MTPVGSANASFYYAFAGVTQPPAKEPAKATPDSNADAIAAARTALARAYSHVDSNLSNHLVNDVVSDEDIVDAAGAALAYAASRATPALVILL